MRRIGEDIVSSKEGSRNYSTVNYGEAQHHPKQQTFDLGSGVYPGSRPHLEQIQTPQGNVSTIHYAAKNKQNLEAMSYYDKLYNKRIDFNSLHAAQKDKYIAPNERLGG